MEWYRWMFLGFAIVFGVITFVFVWRLFQTAEREAREKKARLQAERDNQDNPPSQD